MKRILITGANKGIGLATVAKLLGSYDETFLLLNQKKNNLLKTIRTQKKVDYYQDF